MPMPDSLTQVLSYSLEWEEVIRLLENDITIEHIIGYSDGIVIMNRESMFVHVCWYNPDMISNLFSINDGLNNIFSCYLGQKCETPDHAKILYMAKVLGQHGI